MRSGKRTGYRPLSRKAQVVSLAIGAVLAWQIVSISLAVSHGQSDSDLAATDYEASSPTAATAAAERHLLDGDAEGAAVLARHALAASPISAPALRTLAMAEQNLGHVQATGSLFSQSAALGWRDLPTQMWLAQAYLQAKDYTNATERMDAALRTNLNSPDLFNALDTLLADPKFAEAMVGRTAQNPEWRYYYFSRVADLSPAQIDARQALLGALTKTASPPTRAEAQPLIDEMIRRRDYLRAHTLWERVQKISGPIYDPDFQDVVSGGPLRFQWTMQPLLGAGLTSRPADTGGQSSLTINSDGSASGSLMRQLVTLPPGAHRIDDGKDIPAAARTSVGWVLRCAASGKLLLNTMEAGGPPPYSFSVPSDCDGQIMELHVGRGPSEAFSNITLTHLSVD